jgi:hypothetical protein
VNQLLSRSLSTSSSHSHANWPKIKPPGGKQLWMEHQRLILSSMKWCIRWVVLLDTSHSNIVHTHTHINSSSCRVIPIRMWPCLGTLCGCLAASRLLWTSSRDMYEEAICRKKIAQQLSIYCPCVYLYMQYAFMQCEIFLGNGSILSLRKCGYIAADTLSAYSPPYLHLQASNFPMWHYRFEQENTFSN